MVERRERKSLIRLIDVPDYAEIRDNFARELRLSAQGKKTSLPYIENPLPQSQLSLVQPGDIFQTFVLGGTKGETAVLQMREGGNFTLLKQRAFKPLPIMDTQENFLRFIGDNLAPEARAIGVNFAYNLAPRVGEKGELDGIMNQGDTKGHAYKGMQGNLVGKTVSDYFKDRNIVTTVANDTICLIASGLEENTDRNTLIAAVAGTGYNIALFSDQNTAVNLQASDFTGFTPTVSGRLVDQSSNNVGEQLYNKEVAAGELYNHFNALIPNLAPHAAPLGSSIDLTALAQAENGGTASQLARELLERSAGFVAAQFAGIYEFKGHPESITCITQGSLWEVLTYIPLVEQHLKELGVPIKTFVFKKVDNCDIVGAAKLVTGQASHFN